MAVLEAQLSELHIDLPTFTVPASQYNQVQEENLQQKKIIQQQQAQI